MINVVIERNCPLCKSLNVRDKNPMKEIQQKKKDIFLVCEIGHGMNLRTYHFLHASMIKEIEA